MGDIIKLFTISSLNHHFLNLPNSFVSHDMIIAIPLSPELLLAIVTLVGHGLRMDPLMNPEIADLSKRLLTDSTNMLFHFEMNDSNVFLHALFPRQDLRAYETLESFVGETSIVGSYLPT